MRTIHSLRAIVLIASLLLFAQLASKAQTPPQEEPIVIILPAPIVFFASFEAMSDGKTVSSSDFFSIEGPIDIDAAKRLDKAIRQKATLDFKAKGVVIKEQDVVIKYITRL